MSLRFSALPTTHHPHPHHHQPASSASPFLRRLPSSPLIPSRRTQSSSRRSSSHSPQPPILSLAQDPTPPSEQPFDDGPIELPPQLDPFSSFTTPSSPIQSAVSILFTSTLAVFLYRALRKRAKLVKETKFRSSGLRSREEETARKDDGAVLASVKKGPRPPPSAIQTFQGAIIAGAIAYVLYNFSSYIDAGFASKPVSTVYTIRQLTITIRTIITGSCYLATFVFAANSLGLGLYSIQIALNLTTTPRPSAIENNGTASDVVDSLDSTSAEKVNEEK